LQSAILATAVFLRSVDVSISRCTAEVCAIGEMAIKWDSIVFVRWQHRSRRRVESSVRCSKWWWWRTN